MSDQRFFIKSLFRIIPTIANRRKRQEKTERISANIIRNLVLIPSNVWARVSHFRLTQFWIFMSQHDRNYAVFFHSRFVSAASNHISASREWENLFLFRENFMFRMWGRKKMFLFYIFIRQRKYDIIFHDIAFYAFSHLASFSSPPRARKKVLFHFLMHAKSNGSRHFYAPSIQHQINMKFMLRQVKSESSPPLNDIPAVYSTSKRIPNVIPTCVYVKY